MARHAASDSSGAALVKLLLDRAIAGAGPLLSAESLSREYRDDPGYRDDEMRVDALIRRESRKNFASGFLTGLGGVVTFPVSIPAALGASWLIQARMAAAVAMIYGHDLWSEQVRTKILLSLAGDVAKEAMKDLGLTVGDRLTQRAIDQIPGRALVEINKRIGARLAAKLGGQAVLKIPRAVPVLGGVVGGALDAVVCRTVGRTANSLFKPPSGGVLTGQVVAGAKASRLPAKALGMPGSRHGSGRLMVTALLCLAAAPALALDAMESRIVQAAKAEQGRAIDLLAETVNIESATENHPGVRKVGEVFARELAAIGFETRWVELQAEVGRAGHLVAVLPGNAGKRLLLIGHLDTVLTGESFRLDGNRAYGTGSADMKGGDVVTVEALRALSTVGALQDRQVMVVFTGDEEDPGSPVALSRQALLDAGEASDIALGFEGGSPGLAVIGRRGIATWRLQVAGRQAHSSGIFRENQGYGAVFEAARILDQFREDLPEPYLTYNPSLIVGGTTVTYDDASKSGMATGKTNVIARESRVTGDLRFLSPQQYADACAKMTAIVADSLPGTSASISFEQEYPSMTPTDGNDRVLAVLDAVSRDLGAGPVVAQDPAERGAGDISFVCDGRLECLDGLGAMGDHDHAPGEYLEIDALSMQIQRAALLFYRLTR
jgi:glutamate carboxypeptidase